MITAFRFVLLSTELTRRLRSDACGVRSNENDMFLSKGWSGQSSMTGSFSAMSSGGPSSPENSISRSDMSVSLISNDGYLPP